MNRKTWMEKALKPKYILKTQTSPSSKMRVSDKKNLINAREQIKSKLDKLKMDKQLFHDNLKQNFEPVFKPLETISKNIKQIKKEHDTDREKNDQNDVKPLQIKKEPVIKNYHYYSGKNMKPRRLKKKYIVKKKVVGNAQKPKEEEEELFDLSDNNSEYMSIIDDEHDNFTDDVEKETHDSDGEVKEQRQVDDYGYDTTAGPSLPEIKSNSMTSSPVKDHIDFDNASPKSGYQSDNESLDSDHSQTSKIVEVGDLSEDESIDSDHHANEMVEKYIDALHRSDPDIDKVCGVKYDEQNNSLKLGNSEIKFDDGNIYLGGKSFSISENLLNLLFMKNRIDPDILTEYEKTCYKQMLDISSAHRLKHKPNERIKKHNSNKFKTNIAPLFNIHEGRSIVWKKLSRNKHEHMQQKSLHQMIDRLRLLYASANAGNDGHYGEIASIIRNLEQMGVVRRRY